METSLKMAKVIFEPKRPFLELSGTTSEWAQLHNFDHTNQIYIVTRSSCVSIMLDYILNKPKFVYSMFVKRKVASVLGAQNNARFEVHDALSSSSSSFPKQSWEGDTCSKSSLQEDAQRAKISLPITFLWWWWWAAQWDNRV